MSHRLERALLGRLLAVVAPAAAVAVAIALTPAAGSGAPSSLDASADARPKPVFDGGKWYDVASDVPPSWKSDAKKPDAKLDAGSDADRLTDAR